jgi:hypothetical protein
MASWKPKRPAALSAVEIVDMLDEDDDDVMDLEMDGIDGQEEDSQEEEVEDAVEVVFNAMGEVIERIHLRYLLFKSLKLSVFLVPDLLFKSLKLSVFLVPSYSYTILLSCSRFPFVLSSFNMSTSLIPVCAHLSLGTGI